MLQVAPEERLTLWDRAMALLTRGGRRQAPGDEAASIISRAIAMGFPPEVITQMYRDLLVYPLFDAVAMWVQPAPMALAGAEPMVAVLAEEVILLEELRLLPKRFRAGQIVMTRGSQDAFVEANQSPLEVLKRHLSGDWGNVPPEDARENERSVGEGYRILSSYTLRDGTKVWVITEADRSVTTILLPSEY